MIPEYLVADTPLDRGTTLIEASAGTGKTYTIAGIFLRLIVEENLGVGEILVTTFTEAATAELRDRIRTLLSCAHEGWRSGRSEHLLVQTLIERARIAREIAQRRLTAALSAFDESAIFTIHGFCQRVLKDRAFESHLLFDAELIEDQDAVLRETAEDYWRTHFYEAPASQVSTAMLAGLSPHTLAKSLRAVLAHPELRVIPAAEDLADIAAAIDSLMASFRHEWTQWRDPVRRIFGDAEAWAKGEHKKPEITQQWLALLDLCAADPTAPLDAYSAFDSFTTDAIADGTRARRTAPDHPFFEFCSALATARERFALAVQVDFIAHSRAELPRRKLLRNVISFDDLLTRLRAALNGSAGTRLAKLIRTRFRAALIDEFQDTDPTQEAIFRAIFSDDESRLYLIGDPKQAIYSFRGADVFSYLATARRTSRRFKLATNQRSTHALVQAVNTIFQRSPRPFVVDEIAFEQVAASGRADETPLRFRGATRAPFRFWLPESDEPLGATATEAELPERVAAEISRMLAGGATIGARALAPADVAVLVAYNRQARAMQAALAQLGIPSVLLSNTSVFAAPEAVEMHTLLSALAEPSRHGLVRAALAGRMLGLNAAVLDGLTRDEAAWEKWLLRFQRWHALWRDAGFIQCFRALLRECGVRPRLLARPEGERRLTNVLHISELLHAAATAQRLAPNTLVQWLAAQHSEAPETDENELRLERDEDAVKVITMHKSKGLEYNVVIAPFCWKGAALRKDERPLFHDDTADAALTIDLGTDDLAAHAAIALREKFAEQTRLLYVAMTRAKHECHFVWGRFAKNDASAAMWLLHPPPNANGDQLAAIEAHAATITPVAVREQIAALAASAPDAIAIVPFPDPDGPQFRPAGSANFEPVVRQFSGVIERDWRVSSFTSLTEHRDAELPDYDRAPAAGEIPESDVPPAGIHAFTAGKTAGVCLHAIFEELDFTQPATVDALVERKLHAFGFSVEQWHGAVAECVRRTLTVELSPGLKLVDVPRTARLQELEFYFPVGRLDPRTLSAILHDAGVPRLSFEPRRGLLRGFIDLVFEHDGRFYIVDWKSNRLGSHTAAYDADTIAAAMRRHHYALQYHLYTLALHRHLTLRLGTGYDYARHFGGVFYVFLRGVNPGQPELGIFHDVPPRERIERLASIIPEAVSR